MQKKLIKNYLFYFIQQMCHIMSSHFICTFCFARIFRLFHASYVITDNICKYVCMYINIHIFTYMHMSLCTYINTYTYIYIHIYTHTVGRLQLFPFLYVVYFFCCSPLLQQHSMCLLLLLPLIISFYGVNDLAQYAFFPPTHTHATQLFLQFYSLACVFSLALSLFSLASTYTLTMRLFAHSLFACFAFIGQYCWLSLLVSDCCCCFLFRKAMLKTLSSPRISSVLTSATN